MDESFSELLYKIFIEYPWYCITERPWQTIGGIAFFIVVGIFSYAMCKPDKNSPSWNYWETPHFTLPDEDINITIKVDTKDEKPSEKNPDKPNA